MQVHVTLLAFFVVLVASMEAKPIWSSLYVSNYQYPSEAVGLQPQLVQYQNSPYYLYNVHADVNAIPAAIIANAKHPVSHVPAYGIYYGSPVYDFRLPLNPVYPVLKPVQPGESPKPSPEPSTTARPTEDSEDGIEKLDAKADPEKEMQTPIESSESSDDESVIIESI
ncbi:unnamed protein product [Xylocopa violacea]|uniref:Uncharacterized protein n=1 Tax=Xylocopa violacea TaxID=135666 RepID=A0ABP1P2N6_XYLVO